MPGRVNALLASAASEDLEQRVRASAMLEDLGLRVRPLDALGAFAIEAEAGLLDDRQAAAAMQALGDLRSQARPILTYLANTIRIGDREIPYSLVTGAGGMPAAAGTTPPIQLNEWAARDLGATVGDAVTLEYYVWEDPGRLVTRSASFQLAGVVPTAAADRDMAPSYPGITDAPSLDEWDPPFPLDLRRVRPVDEAYWEQHRATPKAFIPLDVAQ